MHPPTFAVLEFFNGHNFIGFLPEKIKWGKKCCWICGLSASAQGASKCWECKNTVIFEFFRKKTSNCEFFLDVFCTWWKGHQGKCISVTAALEWWTWTPTGLIIRTTQRQASSSWPGHGHDGMRPLVQSNWFTDGHREGHRLQRTD